MPLNNKKIKIVTEVLFALGDFFAAKKLMKQLLEAAPKLELEWLVVTYSGRKDLPTRIHDAKNELGSRASISLTDITATLERSDLNPVDLVLFFPTVHHLRPANFQLLKSIGAPMLQVHEYDAIAVLHLLQNKSDLPYVNPGFDGLGLFLDELNPNELANTLRTNCPAPYSPQTDYELFFSYIAQDGSVAVNDVDFNNYLRIALEVAAPEKSIDMVTNSPFSVLQEDFKNYAWDHGFSEIRFLKKNADNTSDEQIIRSPRKNSSKKTLRLINPFPMSQVQMQALMAHAHPLIQITGDQSLSEALSLGSLSRGSFPFYQALPWKSALHTHMQLLALAYLGKDSPYVHLLKSTDQSQKVNVVEFAKYWRDNHQQILKDSLVFYKALAAEKNLRQNFPQFLDLLFYITEQLPANLHAVNYALLAQLVVKIKDRQAIIRILNALNTPESLAEKTNLIAALAQFLRLNPAEINEAMIYVIAKQLEQIKPKDRVFCATTTCKVITALPAHIRGQWINQLIPDLSKISSGAYATIIHNIEKTDQLEIVQTQANWFTKQVDYCLKTHSSTTDTTKPILLAVNVYSDGVGDIAKFIGTYLHLRKTFPQIEIRTFIRCLETSRPVILAMLRENGIPLQHLHLWSLSYVEHFKLRHGIMDSLDMYSSMNRLTSMETDQFSLIISVATPFKEIHRQIRTHGKANVRYIEVAEVNFCSYLNKLNWLTPRDANHQIVAMGLSEDAVGLEVTSPMHGDAQQLLASIKPELKQKLMDGKSTETNIDMWLQSTFFMPAYLKYDQGFLSLHYALTLMGQHFKEKANAVVWVHTLPFDVTSTSFMAVLKNKGIALLVVHNEQGTRQEYSVPGAKGQRQFRIVCGRVDNTDFNLMYQLAQHTGGFGGCVGQNSFEKTISFDLIPAFYAPRWQLAIIYQCQSLLSKLFPTNSKEYQCLNDYLTMLSTVSEAIDQTENLLLTDSFAPHKDRLQTLVPEQFSAELQKLGRDLEPMLRMRYTHVFGPHPLTLIDNFFSTHDIHLLQSAWRLVCTHIKLHKNLNHWLVERMREIFPITQSVATSSPTKVSPVLNSTDYVRLTKDYFPHSFALLMKCLTELWPAHEKQGLQLFISNNSQLLIDVIPGMSSPTIAVSMKGMNQLSLGEMQFGLKLAVNKFHNYPVENEDFKNGSLSQTELLQGADDYLKYGKEYCRKMVALVRALAEVEGTHDGRKIQRWYELNTQAEFYLDMIKNIELLLAKKHKNDLNGQRASLDSDVLIRAHHEVHQEMKSLEKSWKSGATISNASANEVLDDLLFMLPQLRVTHLYEYQSPSKITRQFLRRLKKLDLTEPNREQVSLLKAIVSGAYEYRSASFTDIYHLVSKVIQPKGPLVCMGPFEPLRLSISLLSMATSYDDALEQAQKIEGFVTDFKYRQLFQNSTDPVTAATHTERRLNSVDECIWSTVGACIDWSRYFDIPEEGDLSYSNYLKWSKKDGTGTIAMVLFRLGMMQVKPLWNLLPAEFSKKLNSTEDTLLGPVPRCFQAKSYTQIARPELSVAKFMAVYLRYRYSYTPRALPDPVTVSSIEGFIETNRHALEIPELTGDAAKDLIRLFEQLLVTNPEQGKEFIRRFYLDSSYTYGLYCLRNDRKQYIDGQFCEELSVVEEFYTSTNTIAHPYLHFLLKHVPDYLPIVDLLDCLAANIRVCYPQWPLSYYYTLLNIRINKLEDVIAAIAELKKYFIAGSLSRSGEYFAAAIANTYRHAAKNLPGVSLFSETTYHFIKKSAEHKVQREVCNSLWAQSEFAKQLYSKTPSSMPVEQLAELYKIFDETMTWLKTEDRDQFSNILFQEILKAPEDKQLKALERLLFANIALSDTNLVSQLIKLWASIYSKQWGEDDLSYPYYVKSAQLILQVVDKAPGLYNKDMLEALAVGIVAQAKICEFITQTLNQQAQAHRSMEDTAENVLIQAAKHLADKNMSIDCVQYLAYNLTQRSLDTFVSRVDGKALALLSNGAYHEYNHKSKEAKPLLLIMFYNLFWNRTIEERAVLFNHLMMPSHSLDTSQAAEASYTAAFNYVAKQLFPSLNEENRMGFALLHSFLVTGHEDVRAFLLTAIMTANKLITGTTKNIVATAPKLAEALGPAGVKAGQAAHSYPRTPKDIRESLAHLKSQSRMPYRWELWDWINSAVPSQLMDQIKRVTKLLGGASFYIAVEVEMLDSRIAVLRLLRKNAKQDAEHGFAHLKAMIAHCQDPKILEISKDLMQIIEEAEEGAKIEIDHGAVATQYKLSTMIYKNKSHEISIGNQRYLIEIQAVKLFEDGPGYQLISKADGVEFNELKKDPKQKALCQAVALAVCKTELDNMLGGGPCDFDRHGAQARISCKLKNGQFHVVVTNYDFGEVSPIPSTPAQLKHCTDFFNQAAAELMSSSNMISTFFKKKKSLIEQFTDKLLTYLRHPQHAANKGELKRLRGIFKGLLALNDFFEVLSDNPALLNQILPVISKYLTSMPTVPVVASKVYGFFSALGTSVSSGATNSNAPNG